MCGPCDTMLEAKGDVGPANFHTPPLPSPPVGGVPHRLSKLAAAPLENCTWMLLTVGIGLSASAQKCASPIRYAIC